MSLTILSRKLDQLNEKQKVLKMTYDVRGNNKHQHRYIKDLKDDFKEDLQLRFGNKPYGLGWNHDSENGSERGAEDEGEEAPEIIDDDDDNYEREVQEEPGVMVSPQTVMSNFRPTSGKTTTFAVHERPFSAASTAGRPMTASSVGRGAGGMPQFLFSQRPISAITKINNRNFQSNTQDISESLYLSMKGQYQSNQPEELTKMQGSRVNQDMSAQMRASESIFWKNTRKYDNNTRSVKQFQTKQLLFHSPTSDPRLINSSDLTFLTQEKIHGTLEKSKLKEPKNHNFHEVAKSKKINKKERGPDGDGSYNGDSQLDAKNSFNQSVSYIHSLRGDAKNSNISGSILSDFESTGKKPRLQRPLTAHPLMSATSPTAAAQKKPLETVAEMVQESNKIYFSSLSDLRKKAFFLKLHSMESEKLEHPGLSKELKLVDWTGFKEISHRPDFQSIHLMLIDLNTFDHGKFELEFQANGSLKAKDKEGVREISSVHKEFLNSTKTNIAAMTIYIETTTNRLIDIFSRVLVYEEKENEYDLVIWKNIYRFVLHKIILANTPLYPELKTYAELSRMIKDIIDDRKDYILPIASQVQLLKDHPIIVERNSHVYNFDFHSYIIECSSYYSHYINGATQRQTGEISHRKTDSKSGENLKQRPASAMAPKTKFPMFGAKQSQNAQNIQTASRKESNHVVDPSMFMSVQNGTAPTSARKDISLVKKPSLKLAHSPEQLIKLDPSRPNSDRKITTLKSDRSSKKPQEKFEKFEMVMQGGRMDIYQDIRAAMGAGRSTTNLRDPSDMMSMTYGGSYGGSEYQKFFSASAMQSPNQDRMFQVNPNGITVQYTKSPMKKKSNVVIRMRPQSAMKAPIQAHKSASSMTALGNAARGDNPYMFNKF